MAAQEQSATHERSNLRKSELIRKWDKFSFAEAIKGKVHIAPQDQDVKVTAEFV